MEVFVSLNGGTAVLFGSSGVGGPYTENASWIAISTNYVFTLYNYSSGSRGAQLGSVSVTGQPATITCGSTSVSGDQRPPGNNVTLSVSAPGATSLYFAITGATTNPYSGQATATLSGTSTWTATVATSSLLGEYKVVPVASDSFGSTTCSNASEVFSVQTSSPAQPGQVPCASMTGTWTDAASGQANFTWTLDQGSGSGQQTITGSATSMTSCGQQLTWTAAGSYYDAGTYNIYGTGGTPATFVCNGSTYTTLSQYLNGSLNSGGSCGLGSGTYEGFIPGSGTVVISGSNTMTATERIPSGESTAFSNWADSYGFPTTAIFNMVLTGAQDMNFGGRRVTETIPSGVLGTDSCYWTGAPWPAPFKQLATQDTWYAQTDTAKGYYGPDYVGLSGDIVAYIQLYAPAVLNSPYSCTIQYPQKMVINVETGSGTEAYGGQQTGYNQIVFTINQSSFSVARGNASKVRLFHF